jgi:hypothetical protein
VGCEWGYDDVAEYDDAEYDDDSKHHATPTRYAPLPERGFEFERGVVRANDRRLSTRAGGLATRPLTSEPSRLPWSVPRPISLGRP